MPPLHPGMIVTPTIRLVSPLGQGGMGSVWVAEHTALHTQVVVKFMSPELAAHAEAIERFSREAAAAAQVKSPHVVQMLDHGLTPDGIPFIAMELLEGRDLGKLLAAQRRIALPRAADVIGQVCKALGRAHERGIIHRDIKPDNIFLCEMGAGETFVKLLDFGIAKGGNMALGGSSGTRTGAMIGTPFYMSPEQVVGAKTIDLRTDLWSLGIVAYECVVGAKPIVADTFGALAIAIHSSPLPRPSEIEPSLPPAFDAWFAKACARDPASRFASARELAEALHAVAAGQPAQVAGGSAPPQQSSGGTMITPGATGRQSSPSAQPGQANATPVGAAVTTGGLGGRTNLRPSGGATPWVLGLGVVLVVVGAGALWVLTHKGSAPPVVATAPASAETLPPAPPSAAAPPAASVVPSTPPAESVAAQAPEAGPSAVSAHAVWAAPAAPPAVPRGVAPQRPQPPAARAKPQPVQEKDIF